MSPRQRTSSRTTRVPRGPRGIGPDSCPRAWCGVTATTSNQGLTSSRTQHPSWSSTGTVFLALQGLTTATRWSVTVPVSQLDNAFPTGKFSTAAFTDILHFRARVLATRGKSSSWAPTLLRNTVPLVYDDDRHDPIRPAGDARRTPLPLPVAAGPHSVVRRPRQRPGTSRRPSTG